VTNSQYIPLGRDEEQCDSCSMIFLKPQGDLVSHSGDWLCRKCRAYLGGYSPLVQTDRKDALAGTARGWPSPS
jgi:ribosomal protein L37AE/L43A